MVVDLYKKGYEVFRSTSPNSSCDLVALKSGESFKVEVKTGALNPRSGGLYHSAIKKTNKYDVLAIVLNETTVVYKPELS